MRENASNLNKFIKEQQPELIAKKIPQDISLKTLSSLLSLQTKNNESKLNNFTIKMKGNNEIFLTTPKGNDLIKITQKGREIKFELNVNKISSSTLDVKATLEALKTAAHTLHTAMLTRKLEEKPEFAVRSAQKKPAPVITEFYNTTAKWQESLSQKY